MILCVYLLISLLWIETTHEDFIDGKISDGLYVSSRNYFNFLSNN